MSTRSTRTLAVAALATALALTGCSGDDDEGGADETPSANGTVTASARASQPAGAIKELSGINCRKGDGGWSFVANLKNTGKDTMTYTVMVAIAKKEGGTVLGSKEFTETLEAGKSKQLKAANFYTGSEADVLCVPSATKAAPQG